MKILESALDVTPEILTAAEEVLDSRFADTSRIDWEEFIDRLAVEHGNHAQPPWDIESFDNPAIRKIKAHIQEVRRNHGGT